MKKLKNQIGISRLSFSIPAWMESVIKERAAGMDLTLSQYIRQLVRKDTNQTKVSP
jgi:hypothetical protein